MKKLCCPKCKSENLQCVVADTKIGLISVKGNYTNWGCGACGNRFVAPEEIDRIIGKTYDLYSKWDIAYKISSVLSWIWILLYVADTVFMIRSGVRQMALNMYIKDMLPWYVIVVPLIIIGFVTKNKSDTHFGKLRYFRKEKEELIKNVYIEG